jgi:hypothetical protein
MTMKGQYFSFDAVIATVIMVLAFSSLVAYWHGAQAVIDERSFSRLSDANRVAEMLLSPGSPNGWQTETDLNNIRQIGIAKGFANELDSAKVARLQYLAGTSPTYEQSGNLMRTSGDYYILIERVDLPSPPPIIAQIGKYPIPANSTYVAIANRGVTYDGHPARMRVFLWKAP